MATAIIPCSKCYLCKERKPLSQFHKDKSKPKGVSSRCLDCCPDYTRMDGLRQRHRITLKEYDALLESQGGVCAICKSPKSQTKWSPYLHVDHDHITGKRRGILCSLCNSGLGQFKDDPKIIAAAIAYIEGSD